jgi:hypothetical protein
MKKNLFIRPAIGYIKKAPCTLDGHGANINFKPIREV